MNYNASCLRVVINTFKQTENDIVRLMHLSLLSRLAKINDITLSNDGSDIIVTNKEDVILHRVMDNQVTSRSIRYDNIISVYAIVIIASNKHDVIRWYIQGVLIQVDYKYNNERKSHNFIRTDAKEERSKMNAYELRLFTSSIGSVRVDIHTLKNIR